MHSLLDNLKRIGLRILFVGWVENRKSVRAGYKIQRQTKPQASPPGTHITALAYGLLIGAAYKMNLYDRSGGSRWRRRISEAAAGLDYVHNPLRFADGQ